MKILYVALSVTDASGGKAVQDRNRRILEEYCGKDFRSLYYDFTQFSYLMMKENDFHFSVNHLLLEIYHSVHRKIKRHQLYRDFAKQVKAFEPDYIFCESSCISIVDKELFRQYKFITFFHNVEKLYYEQSEPDYLTNNAKKTRHACLTENENFICKHASKVICLNERDSQRLREIYGRGADLILKTSMEDRFCEKDISRQRGQYLLFVGTDFFGNTEGLFWFIENCMDHIQMPLLVVGNGMDKYADKYPHRKVKFYGFADDLGKYYRNAAAVVLPIVSGSGMKTKTCEAFMYGKTVIGTTEAFEGYSHFEEAGAILANTRDEFIHAIHQFTEGATSAYSERAREYYLKNHCYEASRDKLFAFLHSLEKNERP